MAGVVDANILTTIPLKSLVRQLRRITSLKIRIQKLHSYQEIWFRTWADRHSQRMASYFTDWISNGFVCKLDCRNPWSTTNLGDTSNMGFLNHQPYHQPMKGPCACNPLRGPEVGGDLAQQHLGNAAVRQTNAVSGESKEFLRVFFWRNPGILTCFTKKFTRWAYDYREFQNRLFSWTALLVIFAKGWHPSSKPVLCWTLPCWKCSNNLEDVLERVLHFGGVIKQFKERNLFLTKHKLNIKDYTTFCYEHHFASSLLCESLLTNQHEWMGNVHVCEFHCSAGNISLVL